MDTQTTTPPRQLADGGLSRSDLFAVALPDTRGNYCYLTRGDGDPPRTYDPKHANRYKTRSTAEAAIVRAGKTTPLRERTMIVVPHPANDQVEARRNGASPPEKTSPPLPPTSC